jgi:hypothetical protein
MNENENEKERKKQEEFTKKREEYQSNIDERVNISELNADHMGEVKEDVIEHNISELNADHMLYFIFDMSHEKCTKEMTYIVH